jgi:phosphohistidine phosphatase SixA
MLAALLLLGGMPGGGLRAGEEVLADRLGSGSQVMLLRHALAPGTGDPPSFRIGDCSTQRNLSDEGRLQARDIGDWLRGRGVEHARVHSSQWCRCLETADLLDFGAVSELPALNSFYGRPRDRAPNLAALQHFLATQPADGTLLILVTHQVTVTALTGVYPASGEGVLLTLDAGGALEDPVRIRFGEGG